MSESTWSPAPPADTYGLVQKLVAGYVLMPTDDEVLEAAAAGIRRAIDRLNTRPWNWALTYDTITFVAGTQEYTVDQGFKAPRNFSLRDASAVDTDRLKFLPWGSFLKEIQDGRSSGSPLYYSGANVNGFGVIRLDLSPDANFVSLYPTGRLWYFARVAYPASSGTSLGVTSEAVAFIQASAEGFTADRYAVDKALSAYSRAERLFHELVVDDAHGQQSDWE